MKQLCNCAVCLRDLVLDVDGLAAAAVDVAGAGAAPRLRVCAVEGEPWKSVQRYERVAAPERWVCCNGLPARLSTREPGSAAVHQAG